jgi:peptidoglycan/LPS O-acetylase OafA/YrhL
LYWPALAPSWSNILLSATFMHAFHPATIVSSVPGGWTIADEMTFYLLFPLLVMTLRTWRAAAWALAAAFGIATLTYPLVAHGYLFPGQDPAARAEYAFLWFPNQLPAFLAGMLVYDLLTVSPARGAVRLVRAGLVAALLAMLAIPFVAAALQSRIPAVMYFMPDAYVLAFAAAALCIARGGGGRLVNAPMRYIGKVSYSAYFWHFLVLGFMLHPGGDLLDPARLAPPWLAFLMVLAIATALTVAAASLTYWLVELPMIALGRQLAGAARPSIVALAGHPQEERARPCNDRDNRIRLQR